MKYTLKEAFSKYDLVASQGAEDSKEACAMTLLAWLCGEKWTDHPDCTHRLIADVVIRANDDPTTTPEMRRRLVKLGVKGVLDTWWLPSHVVLACLSGEDQSPYGAATRLLTNVTAWKKNKEIPDLHEANLCGAKLYGANLCGANLYGAKLCGANLREADLYGADLREADLYGANLYRADLREADLYGADLYGADLYGADLREADLREADLYGADLREADLYGAKLCGANLREVRNLSLPTGWKLTETGIAIRA